MQPHSRFETPGVQNPTMDEKIWTKLYKVRIPWMLSRSKADIRLRGVRTTGISELDRMNQDSWMTTMWTIDQMVDHYKEQKPMNIVVYKDTKDIYDTIHTHLLQWMDALKTGLNMRDAPIDDLVAMDRFANAVYGHAKYLFTPEALESIMSGHIAKVAPLNASNFFNKKKEPDPNQEYKPAKVEKHPDRENLEEKLRRSAIHLGNIGRDYS